MSSLYYNCHDIVIYYSDPRLAIHTLSPLHARHSLRDKMSLGMKMVGLWTIAPEGEQNNVSVHTLNVIVLMTRLSRIATAQPIKVEG